MTETTDASTGDTNRRTFLRGAGVTGAVLGGFATPALARKGGKSPLNDIEADFRIYFSMLQDPGANDPNEANEFSYSVLPQELDFTPPSGQFLLGYDMAGGGLFDASQIEATPNMKTLQHDLKFFAGFLMETKPKPYVLNHVGDGLYESRGQSVNFTAREADEINTILSNAGFPPLANYPPLSVLSGNKWRGVATEQVQLDVVDGGVTKTPDWAVTRVDFFTRPGMDYTLSLLYVIWESDEPPSLIPTNVDSIVRNKLITPGRLNPGGQSK